MKNTFSLFLSLAAAASPGFLKVGIDDGSVHHGPAPAPQVKPRSSTEKPGYLKMNFDVESNRPKLKARQLDEGDLDQNITLSAMRNLYSLNLELGTPPQRFKLQIDTGSSNLWIPDSAVRQCRDQCPGGSFNPDDSSTYQLLEEDVFSIGYLDGTGATGDFFSDVVTIGEATIDSGVMALGLARQLQDGESLENDGQGLVGIGYWINQAGNEYFFNGTVNNPPTLIQALVNNGDISREAYSIYLNDVQNGTGAIIFGGVDANQYSGELVALQTLEDPNGSDLSNYTHFEVALTGIGIEDEDGLRWLTPDGFAEPALLDTGTTITYLPSNIFRDVAQGFGVNFGLTTMSNRLPCNRRYSSASLVYQFGGSAGKEIRVGLSELIDLDDRSGTYGDDDNTASCFFLMDQFEEPYVMLGNSFMRSGYFVYDLENHVVAMAQSKPNATSDDVTAMSPSGTEIPGCTSTNTYTISNRVASPTVPSVTLEFGNPYTVMPAEPTFALGDLSEGAAKTQGSSSGGGGNSGAAGTILVPLWQVVLGMLSVGVVGRLF